MGQVFEAEQPEIGKRVAIKTLHPEFSQNAELANRFLNEARAVNLIKHPSIVNVFEYGKLPDGVVYIVMEFLEGETLTQRIASGILTIPASMRLCRQIASALQAAHDKGIVHRDLKPDNVFISPDPEAAAGERAKILDFGIAKLSDEHKGEHAKVRTQAGVLLGTPLYMSPEQCDGMPQVDAKSDVYSLGIILYEMLTGSPPFPGPGVSSVMMQQVGTEPRPIREVNPIIPEPLALLIHSMLAKSPLERPAMGAVASELERLSGQRTPALEALAEVDQPPAVQRSMAEVLPIRPTVEPAVTLAGDGAIASPVRSAPPLPIASNTQSGAAKIAPVAVEESADKVQAPPTPSSARKRRPWAIPVAVLGLAIAAGGGFLFLRPTKVRVAIRIVGDIGAGQVTSDPMGIDCGDVCIARFAKGDALSLTARPAPNYVFAGWGGDCTGTDACKLQPRWEQQIEARFVRDSSTTAPAVLPPPPHVGGAKKGAKGNRRP